MGSLNNAGEWIELADALGGTILSFRYRDGWYAETDGGGFSLEVVNPTRADPYAHGDQETWQPTPATGGSPGRRA